MLGLDVGTMHIVSAVKDGDNTIFKSIRNSFVEIDPDVANAVDLTKVAHANIDDSVYILGVDAYNLANIFGHEVKRPMRNGLLSPKEIDAVDVLTLLIKSIIPEAVPPSKDGKRAVCTYSSPAASVDAENSVVYHREVLKRVLSSLGYEPDPINEALAIIYSECMESGFTGIAISFGAGMTNVCFAYKSVPVLEFSVQRGGDWIDENTALATGTTASRACAIKEKPDFNLSNWQVGKKRERRVREALTHYYKELISYTSHNIAKRLLELDDVQLPSDVPIVLSGGTSLVVGFTDIAKDILENQYAESFPFDITDVRVAGNQLTSVANGCLIRSLL